MVQHWHIPKKRALWYLGIMSCFSLSPCATHNSCSFDANSRSFSTRTFAGMSSPFRESCRRKSRILSFNGLSENFLGWYFGCCFPGPPVFCFLWYGIGPSPLRFWFPVMLLVSSDSGRERLMPGMLVSLRVEAVEEVEFLERRKSRSAITFLWHVRQLFQGRLIFG